MGNHNVHDALHEVSYWARMKFVKANGFFKERWQRVLDQLDFTPEYEDVVQSVTPSKNLMDGIGHCNRISK